MLYSSVPDGGPSARPREIIVTGAAGFVGSHISTALAHAGHPVTGVDVRVPARPPVPGVCSVEADFTDPEVLDRVRTGSCAAVVHQAAISDTMEQDWAALRRVNVAGTLDLARACADAGTPFIYASSHSVYGSLHERAPVAEDAVHDGAVCTGPLNPYARSKLEADEELSARGTDSYWVGLRYTNVFGTGEDHKGRMASILGQMLRAAATGRTVRLFSDTLHACRDYVPVEAVAATVLRLVTTRVPSGVYNLGAGHPVSFATVLEWCAEVARGRQLDVRLVPNEVPGRYQYWTCADMSKLGRALDGDPRVPPQDVKAAAEALAGTFAGVGGEADDRADGEATGRSSGGCLTPGTPVPSAADP
ncbi:NAD-dependent epimerase/dehydratase family protein [Streptomyces chrestomyceticus]|uniref:NAD-dependent epimerase/dehydratase family protein n=1 Tax=Streptomyces chrestomyceticus TaxID=68185 RepID=A0ABU7WPT6_9ACTN